jgi:DNA gyrase subunit A
MTDGGYAKRTRISEYRLQSRGGLGIKAMQQNDDRGNLVGAFIVEEGDEVLSVTSSGQVVRSPINDELRPKGRSTMGVTFVKLKNTDSVSVVARSVERAAEIDEAVEEAEAESDAVTQGAGDVENADSETIGGDGDTVPSNDETDADSDTEET